MAIWNKHFYKKYPDCQVEDPDGAEGTFWCDFAVVYDHLVETGRLWDGEGEVVRFAMWCSDRHDANVVRVEGRGWFAVTKAQARELAEQFDV